MTTQMSPSDIRYIQNNVADDMDGRPLISVFEDLVSGRLRAENMSAIEVVPYKGLNYAFDGNRRLLLFKKLQQRRLLHTIPVKIKNRPESGVMMKYSTKDNGQSISVRGNPGFDAQMESVLRKYGR